MGMRGGGDLVQWWALLLAVCDYQSSATIESVSALISDAVNSDCDMPHFTAQCVNRVTFMLVAPPQKKCTQMVDRFRFGGEISVF